MTGLEAAEMRFLRSVRRYTRLDKIRSEIIRKELEIPGIQDVRNKKTKLRGLSPHANYTDRAAAAGRRS